MIRLSSPLLPVRLVVVAILATLAIGLSAPAAQAAPPEVKASENPVTFTCPVQRGATKTIALNWSVVPGTQLPSLVVTEGAQTVLSKQYVNQSSGAETLPVAYGKTYVAQLKDVLSQPLGQPLIITTTCAGSGGIEFDPSRLCGILISCNAISVTPDVHGTYATFAISVTKAASFELQVGKKVGGQCGPVEKAAFNLQKTLAWTSWPIVGLDAGTPYCYTVIATDTDGLKATKKGEFTTRQRRVKVRFADIAVYDDSDGGPWDDAEPFFWWRINGACVGLSDYWDETIKTGQTVHPNHETTITNAPATLTLAVLGVDDDGGWGKPFVSGCWSDSYKQLGEWSSASTTFDIGPTGDTLEEFQKSFLLSAFNGDFTFTVSGFYAVSFP